MSQAEEKRNRTDPGAGSALEGPGVEGSKTGSGIRLRAIVLGLVLSVVICALTPFNNVYRQGTLLGGGHFPLASFFILFWLTVLVALSSRLFKGKQWLTGRELLSVWMLTVLSSGIAYTGLVRTFFINLTAPYHFATVGNRWAEVLQPLLPKAWYPQNQEAIELMYNGLSGGRHMSWWEVLGNVPWETWLTPLLVWGGFVFLCYFVMICTVNLLSRQWLQNERMNFPLLQVPLLMEEAVDRTGLGQFLGNPYLLGGLAIPVFLHLLNGLHFYIPSVPEIPTMILAGEYFPKFGLFSAFSKLKMEIYPAFIGFAFLAPRQISFSMWGFFVMGGLVIGILSVLGYDIPAAALGVTFGPNLTRPEEMQMIGAYGIFFLFILWLGRQHLLDILREAVGLKKPSPLVTEWFSIRVSFWGFALGGLGIVFWFRYFGMPLMVSFLVVGAFFMVMLVASRVICQGGIAYFTLTAAPIDGLLALLGPKFITGLGLVLTGVVQKMLFVDLRESLMPSLFHSSKVTQQTGGRRLMLVGMGLTLVCAVVVSFVAMLALCYKYGVRELQLDWATRTTIAVTENVQSLIEAPAHPGHWVIVFTVAGALVMLALVVCYHRFYWWPIHPIGYLMAYSTAMQLLWFSFLVGWLSNSLCMRYGGVALFKKLRLFFIGLIIGDFLMGGVWAMVGLFGDASYSVLPN